MVHHSCTAYHFISFVLLISFHCSFSSFLINKWFFIWHTNHNQNTEYLLSGVILVPHAISLALTSVVALTSKWRWHNRFRFQLWNTLYHRVILPYTSSVRQFNIIIRFYLAAPFITFAHCHRHINVDKEAESHTNATDCVKYLILLVLMTWFQLLPILLSKSLCRGFSFSIFGFIVDRSIMIRILYLFAYT